MSKRFLRGFLLFSGGLTILLACVSLSFAAEKRQIIVNGDRVEFFSEQKKIVAEGNVVIVYQDSKLSCDKVTVFSDTNDAVAEGHVRLTTAKGNLEGEKLIYNFTKKSGTILGAKLQAIAQPFFGASKIIEKVNDQHIAMVRGYLTTCDLAIPHYRMSTRRIDIYPGEKITMKDVRFRIGDTTLFYLPSYTQVLNDKRPHVTVVPGYDKNFGMYILQAWRYYLNENAKGQLHLDYREKKDFAWGVDYSYKILHMGEGLIRTYYMNERSVQSKRLIYPMDSPVTVKERFKAEWRHKWQVDRDTNIILQYYKLKDSTFLQDYFEREYEKDEQPKSFFLLTRTLPLANLSFDVEKRVNNFFPTTQRLPQLKLDLYDYKLGDTRFYFKNQTTYDNVSYKPAQPSPTEVAQGKQTQRVDALNVLSYQQKIFFLEARPNVGIRETYYSRGNATTTMKGFIRTVFSSGFDLSTKFYRVFDVTTNALNLDLNKLRHIITPTFSYNYTHQPTVDQSKLYPFDEIDTVSRQNTFTVGIENKLQTKRQGASVDLLRVLLSADYLFKGYPAGSRFNHIRSDFEINPYNWLSFTGDTDYDTNIKKFQTANYDLTASGGDNWSFGLGQRYQLGTSNQFTGEVSYRLNPLWKLRAYERFEQRTSSLVEQEYTIVRDLHCWEMDINFNTTRGEGNSIWLVFRIKAFPKMGFEFQNAFHGRKAGSQSPTEEQY